MVSLARTERKAARLVRDVKDIDLDDLYDQLENLRDYVDELSQSVGKSASRQYGRARAYTSEAAKEAEKSKWFRQTPIRVKDFQGALLALSPKTAPEPRKGPNP